MGLQQQKDNVDREYRQRHRQTHIDGQTEGTDGQTGQNTYRKDKIQAAHQWGLEVTIQCKVDLRTGNN